jgi:histidyl-tRNA synthetase
MKPSLPQGTRDFGPEVVRRRNYIFNTIRSVFELYGFQPLETPAMENLETLLGKYGEEGDKLIFKVLNNGLNDPKNIADARAAFEKMMEGKNDRNLTQRALRYDLTIPFARYVAMNHTQLTFPYKRYQVQPVWRADRPQKGRYREFYQCDADVVGSTSLLNEVEFALIYLEVFQRLGLRQFELRLNSRKVLAGLAEQCGGSDQLVNITTAIDKLDKIGIARVQDELKERGLNATQVSSITTYLSIDGTNSDKMLAARGLLGNSKEGSAGLDEIDFLLKHPALAGESKLVVDFTLARGLNYYTGLIFEVKPIGITMGSIGGGGRYDDLTGLFGVPNIPGAGISFGVDRIYDVLEELQLFPATLNTATTVLFFNLGAAEAETSFLLMQQLRARNTSCEMFPEQAKFDKQFKYATKKNIPYAVIIGPEETEKKEAIVKDLNARTETRVTFSELTGYEFKQV